MEVIGNRNVGVLSDPYAFGFIPSKKFTPDVYSIRIKCLAWDGFALIENNYVHPIKEDHASISLRTSRKSILDPLPHGDSSVCTTYRTTEPP